ncbi:hypothetical protein [Haloarcula amylolytica]|uniref:hypothetical protein n=1 Tax=Haloarcula amylolytica TaxID=396317 RepID=UPI003C768E0B
MDENKIKTMLDTERNGQSLHRQDNGIVCAGSPNSALHCRVFRTLFGDGKIPFVYYSWIQEKVATIDGDEALPNLMDKVA